MCGIAGSYAYNGVAEPVDRTELERISAWQRQRGPDAQGFWYADDQRLGLAHQRLAIIDLSHAANQPMLCGDGRYVIVFNGEIYNYRQLRQQLQDVGLLFATASDTEVIGQGYHFWGLAVLNKLRGMFAFTLWDRQERKLLLARDPYGIKPLYYADDGRVLRFASTVQALRQGHLAANELDPAGVTGFLLMGSVPEPWTMYRAIRLLAAGHFMLIDEDGCHQPQQYCSVAALWQEAQIQRPADQAEEPVAVIAEAVRDSVRQHMVADVPVGAFLSAGIDSGAIVGLMSQLTDLPVQTITLGFAEFRSSRDDETELAAVVAQRYGTSHQTCWLSDQEIRQDLPAVLAAMDQPSVDGSNTWLVSKVARQLGLKVVLSGLGGDELLGGYPYFRRLPRWYHRLHIAASIPGLLSLSCGIAHFLARHRQIPAKSPAVFAFGKSLAGLYFAQRGLFMPWELAGIVGEDMARAGLAELAPPECVSRNLAAGAENNFASLAALEASQYLRNQLLRDSDWASMAHSLELRTPLVDVELLSTLAPYLVHCRADWQRKKGLAAAPLPALPEQIVQRPKSGFSLPMRRWLEEVDALSGWRHFPALRHSSCHWSRRMAGVVLRPYLN